MGPLCYYEATANCGNAYPRARTLHVWVILRSNGISTPVPPYPFPISSSYSHRRFESIWRSFRFHPVSEGVLYPARVSDGLCCTCTALLPRTTFPIPIRRKCTTTAWRAHIAGMCVFRVRWIATGAFANRVVGDLGVRGWGRLTKLCSWVCGVS